jgi:hypothetical protein
MIIILGSSPMAAAAIVAVAGVPGNGGSAHAPPTSSGYQSYHVTGSGDTASKPGNGRPDLSAHLRPQDKSRKAAQ